MNMQKQIHMFLRLLAASFLCCLFYSDAHAIDYAWPGFVTPCDSTLQDCIDNVGAGDTIEIDSTTVDESITIGKSLTLRPASPNAARFINTHSIVINSTGTTDNVVTIEGLIMETGVFVITHSSTGTFTLNLRDNIIEQGYTTNPAIRFFPINGGITYFDISSNTITVPNDYNAHGIQVHATTSIDGIIKNNVVVMGGTTQGSAIDVTNLQAPSAIVDISGNTITGTNINDGIYIYQYTSGCTTYATVANNLITGQAGNTGAPGALVYNVSDGFVELQVVNNTVADNEEGIMINCSAGTAAGTVANNIAANNSSTGLYIDSSVAGTVSNNNNLLYNNFLDDFTPGTGTLYENPSFVKEGDYRLRPGSAAVNSGDNGSIPSGITTDLAGNRRIIRWVVDIGAYEQAVCITPLLFLLTLD